MSSSGPRILLLTDSDVFAGTERHILSLATELIGKSHAACIACPGHAPLAERARIAGIRVVDAPKNGTLDLGLVRALAAGLRRGDYSILHSHNGRTALHAAVAASMAGKGAFVMTEHFLAPTHTGLTGLKGAFYRRAHRWVERQAAAVIAVSEAARDELVRRNPDLVERVHVVPNGIQSALPTVDSEVVRHRFGVARDELLVVCVARLEVEKGLDVLVEALHKAAAVLPSIRCIIAGEGKERLRLEGMIRQRSLEQVVQLPGHLQDAVSLMAAADVLVLPSLVESFGMTLVEAMSLGKAVVATSAGGPLEIVEHEKTGLLVPPSDAQALAHALVCLLKDRPLREAYGAEGYRRFLARYTAEQMAQATAAVYAKCIEAARQWNCASS